MKPALAFFALAVFGPLARADDFFNAAIDALTKTSDRAQFEIRGKDAQIAALESAQADARDLEQRYPAKAEPLVIEGEDLSYEAGVVRGRKALSMVSRARTLFEKAESIDPDAFGDGSVYTDLGVLYYQAPGFPIAFGSKKRARAYLERALAANPNGIDPNYFMGEFQYRERHYEAAIGFLNRALAAPDRPGRGAADASRRADAAALLAEARGKLN